MEEKTYGHGRNQKTLAQIKAESEIHASRKPVWNNGVVLDLATELVALKKEIERLEKIHHTSSHRERHLEDELCRIRECADTAESDNAALREEIERLEALIAAYENEEVEEDLDTYHVPSCADHTKQRNCPCCGEAFCEGCDPCLTKALVDLEAVREATRGNHTSVRELVMEIRAILDGRGGRKSTISPEDVDKILEKSLSTIPELRKSLEQTFDTPPDSTLRLKNAGKGE